MKLEYSETDYDDISATTSNNKIMNIDTEILALSVARSF